MQHYYQRRIRIFEKCRLG